MAKLRLRVRFDYISNTRTKKTLFGGKSPEQAAEETRQHRASLMRNVPIQGITIEDIDMSQEIYSVYDEINGRETAYAPVIINFTADSMEHVIKFAAKEELKVVQVLDPDELTLSSLEIERLLIAMSEEMVDYKRFLERKVNNWR
ncbi:MAG: hypothetical protein ACM3PE_10365 [Deltaproteobacteria bacterium]